MVLGDEGRTKMKLENVLALAKQEREGVEIPEVLIEKLKPFGPRFVKVEPPQPGDKHSGKAPFEREFQKRPYEADDPELQEWLTAGGNYGILGGQGLIHIETDDKKMAKKLEPYRTFATRSGSGRGDHRTYRSDATENGVLIHPKTGKNLGNIQVKNRIIVGPNCHHYTGGTYKIIDDSPIAWLSKAEMEEIFGEYLSWTGKRRREIEEQSLDEQEQIGFAIPLKELIDLSEMQVITNGEYQGEHPIHGSETGQNFCVNVKKNLWHCFRCNSGGGGLMWIAVKHGIIKCHEAQKGALKGEKFIEALKKAADEGFDIKLWDDDLSPDVERFYDVEGKKKKFRAAYVVKELMEEYTYFTRRKDQMVFRYLKDKGIYEMFAETHVKQETRRKLGKHTSTGRQKEVLNFVQVSTYKDIEESPEHHVALKNGILNIKTGQLEDFNPDYFILNVLNVARNPKADCPTFKKFLSEVVAKEDIPTIQEYIGYCLLRDYRFHKTLLFVGEGSNGKSTLLEVLRTLLGNENVSNEPLQTLMTNRFALGQLYGKLANIYADLPAIALRDTGFFKMITGNDTIGAEFKFRDRFYFKSYAKLIFSCNRIPETPDDTTAFFRRWIIINFPNVFADNDPKTDKNMLAKLTTSQELSGILNWAIVGLHRLLANERFTKAKTVEETRQQYVQASNPIRAFAEEHIEAAPNNVIPKDEVYDAYITYCHKHNLSTTTKNAFSMRLPEYCPSASPTKTKRRGRTVRAWSGIRLTSGEAYEAYAQIPIEVSEKDLKNINRKTASSSSPSSPVQTKVEDWDEARKQA